MQSKKRKNTKKETRRSKQAHPELDRRYSLKTRADLLDQDYLHKLDKSELEWLNKFNKEYVSGTLDREKPRKNLHKTKRLIKDCDDRNNSRNRDIMTREKAANRLTDYESLLDQPRHKNEEDVLIKELDKKEILEAIEWVAEENDKEVSSIEKSLIIEQED